MGRRWGRPRGEIQASGYRINQAQVWVGGEVFECSCGQGAQPVQGAWGWERGSFVSWWSGVDALGLGHEGVGKQLGQTTGGPGELLVGCWVRGASKGLSMGEVMGEGPAGRTRWRGGLDMARLKGKVLGLLVRGWGQGLSRVLGCEQNGRSSGWQGRQMAGCGAWAGVGGCWRVRRSVLRLREGVGGAGGGAMGRGCWFRQLCSMQVARVSSPSPTDSWEGSHGWGSGVLASKD